MIWIAGILFVLVCFLAGVVFSQLKKIKRLNRLLDNIGQGLAIQIKKIIRDDNHVEKNSEKNKEENGCFQKE